MSMILVISFLNMRLFVGFLLVFSVSFNFVHSILSTLPHVRVEQGELIGTYYTTLTGRTIYAFHGVPYAAPPVHKYRFREPQPVKPWAGVWNATTQSSICLQYKHNDFNILGEEDCLYLNIYTPKLPQNGVSQLMNVLVYIHGGAFMFGDGHHMFPDLLLKSDDVILITVNYRVGALGFFSTGDDIIPGNNGLKDQVAALKWIQHNIIKFGGNPASVTIMGMSAGGASVHYHYISPLSEGLFQRGISQSGTVLLPWTLPKNVTENTIQAISALGCPMTTLGKDIMKCLQKRPAKQIIETTKTFQGWRYSPFTVFGPVVEPASPSAFISEEPINLLLSGKFSNLPWLVSTVDREGLYPSAEFIRSDALLNELDQHWNHIAPYLLFYNYIPDVTVRDNISKQLREYYFKGRPISKDVIVELIQVICDRLFFLQMRQAMKIQASLSQTPIYCYRFNYRGKYSLSNIYAHNKEDYGVSHGDDLQYILHLVDYYSGPDILEVEKSMVDIMVPITLSFIKSGKPEIPNVVWEPIDTNINNAEPNCLKIDSPSKLYNTIINETESLNLWSSLLPNEYVFDQSSLSGAKLKDEL